VKNLYALLTLLVALFLAPQLVAQPCFNLKITSTVPHESRCMATGTINVSVAGGSGNYNYKVTGPINTPFTSAAVISGLSAGTYTVIVQDVTTGCIVEKPSVVVTGTYVDPRFTLVKTDETCLNQRNGTISLSSLTGGRAPYTYTIVAPSPSGVGTSNTTGTFTGLRGGEYAIELKDSCGGIQTRRVTILGYNWWIESHSGDRVSCQDGDFDLRLRDSRGNVNTTGTIFDSFNYGVVNSPGDTSWYGSRTFTHTIGNRRSVTLVAKDGCGNVRYVVWNNNRFPSVANLVTTSNQSCNNFSAQITGQSNLVNPTYCLFTASNVQVECNTTGIFTSIQQGSYYITVRDDCYDTTIRRNFILSQPKPTLSDNVNINRTDCNTFDAAVNGMVNFTNPDYCLYDASGTQLSCNNTGNFTSLQVGSYCIRVKDACYDTTISRCFTVAPLVPSVAASVTVSDRQCGDFDVSISGQSNISNAQYCLYTSSGTLIGCNSNGNFSDVPYGDYCMRIINDAACYDTIIVRCFNVVPQPPAIGANLDVVKVCSGVTISAAGQAGLTNPQYCLYDAADVLIGCNNTGVFPGMPYGTYCMTIKNDPVCYDTLFRRCITVVPDRPSIGSPDITSRQCSSFDVSVTGRQFLSNPLFTLKDASGTVVAINTTGDFTGIAYGSYCIEMQNDASCYDTVITRCFTGSLPQPSAGSAQISNRNCSTFTAKISSVTNVRNPLYSLLDVSGTVVATNTDGTFNDILYGDYCIAIKDGCYDTTITRCFTSAPDPVDMNITAIASCILNTTNLRINITSGSAPYTIRTFDHLGTQVKIQSGSGTSLMVNNLPGLPPGEKYTVEIEDACGNKTSRQFAPVLSTFNSALNLIAKCPSGVSPDGSSELTVSVSSNLGTINPVIISRDGLAVNMPYNTSTTSVFKWLDLAPATYVMQYNLPGSCNNKAFDTITVGPYRYPQLDKSASYQCDNNSFSVGANVTGGAPPFTYEIIGSAPASPSIVSLPQASPVFSINNGNIYSLVRLRAVDYCGNATLNDVSVLPLQNTVVTASSDCYYSNVVLSADSIANATYQWYRKSGPNDSTLVSSSRTYEIPYLSPELIGTYVSRMTVNNGCLVRLNYHEVTGTCNGGLLAGKIELRGKHAAGKNNLSWNPAPGRATRYVVERKVGATNVFDSIGSVRAGNGGVHKFSFTDEQPQPGVNQYRIRAVDAGGIISYSNPVQLKANALQEIQVYPNPVQKMLNISLYSKLPIRYKVQLFTATGQMVYSTEKVVSGIEIIRIMRQPSMKSGLYLLKVRDLETGADTVEKLVFE
jgi:hypothetical protein